MEKKYVTPELSREGFATKGKAYEVISLNDAGDLAEVVLDDGENHYVLTDKSKYPCAWLEDRGNWVFTNKYVRPAMTPEARDILNNIHETVGAETRSDSIVEFMDRHTDMEVELCARKQEINELEFKCGAWKDKFFRTKKHLANSELAALEWKSKFVAEKLKHKGWIIYSAIVAAYAIGVSVYCLIGG